MIRKTTAYLVLLLLGFYLPAASMTVNVCLDTANPCEPESCCSSKLNSCEDPDPCCDDSDCCIIIHALPDGMEPQVIHAPDATSLPAPLVLADEFVLYPVRDLSRTALPNRAPPPPPGAPIRIALGVWRL